MKRTNGPLPQEWLATRNDQPWESEEDLKRITYAKRWATRRIGELFAAQDLGADESDPVYRDRVAALWRELEARLTRGDLLRVFLDMVEPAAAEYAQQIRASYDAEVDALIGEPQWPATGRKEKNHK